MEHFDFIPRGLEQSDAMGMILDSLARFDDVVVAFNTKDRAIGLIGVRGTMKATEIHALWFSWSSPRDILEAGFQFLKKHVYEDRRWAILYGHDKTQEEKYLTKIAKTGIIRRCGTWVNHPEGEMATFETRHVDK